MDNETLVIDCGTESVVGGSEPKVRRLADTEDDVTLQLRAFGTLPPVRTLRLTGSRCDVLEWLDSPRQ